MSLARATTKFSPAKALLKDAAGAFREGGCKCPDHPSASSDLPADLSHQVYDGVKDEAAFSRTLMTRLGVACPVQVRAVQHRHLPAPKPAGGCLAFAVHEGLVAWIGEAVPRPPPPFISGKALVVEHPEDLIAALQQAIIAMRQVELQALKQQLHRYLTPDDEKNLIQLTVQELRHRPEQALPLATTCCQMLTLRYSIVLNDLRRKLLELMAAAMAQAGSHAPVSHAYMQTVQRILSTYVLSEFMDWFPQQLVHVATLAAQARREAVTSRSPLVSSARHYLEHRFTAPVSLQHVATALHVSKEHLARVFRQETGETVVKALNRLRIEAAKEQLTSSTASLKTIAGNCGFGSVEHFQRLFRREVGITPGGCRR